MNMVIWKFPLNVVETQDIKIPRGTQILDAQIQTPGKDLCIWALVDKTQPYEIRTFAIFATGQIIESKYPISHISTFQPQPGLVFHLFEVHTQLNRG